MLKNLGKLKGGQNAVEKADTMLTALRDVKHKLVRSNFF